MGFLRLILQLPVYILYIIWEASLYFIVFLCTILRIILWAISPLIGDINWSIPKWYPKVKECYYLIGSTLSKYRTLIGSMIIISIITFFTANYTYHWYLNRPKPIDPAPIVINYYSYNYDGPTLSGYGQESSGSNLEIRFRGHSRSPAPLDLIGKTITDGISIYPNIEGTWTWYNYKTIRFKPNTPWPLGTEYKVTLDSEKLFSEKNKLKDDTNTFAFTTKDFSYTLSKKEFYQDPQDKDNRMGIFTIDFSHAVNKDEFKKHVALNLYKKNEDKYGDSIFIKKIDYTVSYNSDDTIAYIKSEQLSLPDVDNQLYLTIYNGVQSSLGGTPSKKEVDTYITIPNRYDLSVSSFDISLVEVNDNEMRQILSVKLNHDIKPTDLQKVIKV